MLPPTSIAPDPCARCGYALHGIADDAACPECGLLAERSRQRSDHLADATPRWLRGIARGVTLILLAHVVAGAWPFLIEPVQAWAFNLFKRPIVGGGGGSGGVFFMPNSPLFEALSPFVPMAGFDLAAILLAIGAWLLTRPQGRPASDAADRGWRRALRITSSVPLAVLVYLHVRLAMNTSRGVWFSNAEIWSIALTLTLGGAAIAPLMFFHLRRLARRVLHPGLAEHAAIVGVGFAASLVLVPVVSAIVNGRSQDAGWSNSWVPLALLTFMSVSFLLFAGWSALNCVRFILAFRKAYRGAIGKWSAADRAALPEG